MRIMKIKLHPCIFDQSHTRNENNKSKIHIVLLLLQTQ